MKLRKSCFGMDYEMETIIQALVIQINMVWNQFHEIIHELIRYAHALTHIDILFVEVCTVAHLLYKQNRKNTPPSSKSAVIMGKET